MSDIHRTSISLPKQLFNDAEKRAKDLGYSTFSDYLQVLIAADTSDPTSPHLRSPSQALQENGPIYHVHPKQQAEVKEIVATMRNHPELLDVIRSASALISKPSRKP